MRQFVQSNAILSRQRATSQEYGQLLDVISSSATIPNLVFLVYNTFNGDSSSIVDSKTNAS